MKKEKKQTRIPKKAREEMHAILSGDAKVPAEALEQVLIKYKVSSPVAQLREQDRKRRVQRFSARYRDTDGCRDVLAHLDREAKGFCGSSRRSANRVWIITRASRIFTARKT